MRETYSIAELCDALDVSRSGYHAATGRAPSKRHQENQKLVHAMKTIHRHRHTRAYGSPRMTPHHRRVRRGEKTATLAPTGARV